MTPSTSVARVALDIPPRDRPSTYPQAIQTLLGERLAGREKRALGDAFGLANFGVNLTRLAPGAVSALRHAHSRQDELVYILAGSPTLCTNEGSMRLAPGMCAGFRAGTGNASQLLNETGEDVLVLEIGDRSSGDEVTYPDDDLFATFVDGQWRFFHQDGTPY